jgi:hypothetical protein
MFETPKSTGPKRTRHTKGAENRGIAPGSVPGPSKRIYPKIAVGDRTAYWVAKADTERRIGDKIIVNKNGQRITGAGDSRLDRLWKGLALGESAMPGGLVRSMRGSL